MFLQDSITTAKEARIDLLRSKLGDAADRVSIYHLYDALYAEYEKWNVDSAFAYVHKKSELAAQISDGSLNVDATIDLANCYTLAGMYLDAIAAMQQIDNGQLKESPDRHRYHYLMYDIYHALQRDTHDARKEDEYRQKAAYYLNLCDRTIRGDIIEFYNNKANILIGGGRPLEAITLMKSRLEGAPMSIDDKAMLNYWIGKAYLARGDRNKALYYYSVGARYDYLSPVKIYGSPIPITRMCLDAGDLERANRYIIRNFSDAHSMGARYRKNLIAELIPLITFSYTTKVEQQNRHLINLSFVLFILLMALGISLIILFVNRQKLFKANSAISRQAARLKESNHFKDAYLGQFLSMFSEHIDSLERYRSGLRVIAKKMDFEAIQQELRSDSFIDVEREMLFDKFDKTILGLLPDFPEQLNLLLKSEKRLELPKAGKLTNEVRIFALIRLGITDSKRIAMFLQLSPSTVYNYRVKLRNAAVDGHDAFEDGVKKIGTIV